MDEDLLLRKIAVLLQCICDDNRLYRIDEVVIEVSYNCTMDNEYLHKKLVELIPRLVDKCTIITLKKKALEEEGVVIYMLRGSNSYTERA